MDGAFQALIAAMASFLVISSIFLFFILLCRRPPKPQTLISPPNPRNHNLSFSSFDASLPNLSLSTVAAATANFAAENIVGDGGFGFVYKAVLSTGRTVAVKKLNTDAPFGFREFHAELETLAKIHSPYLVKILGYCVSGLDRVIIYEFLEKGSLDFWIHEKPGSLSWGTRVRVMVGVGKGLCFLHDECRPCILHRDIKASNVLLDEGFGARIADFGLARPVGSGKSHVSTQVAGTMGYMPPEYRDGYTVATVKGDVYSFGVLMFEVVSGRRPNWPVKGEDGKEVWMVKWARGLMEAGKGLEMLDPSVRGEDLSEEEVNEFLDVAYKCTDDNAKRRPGMKEVVSMLEVYVNK